MIKNCMNCRNGESKLCVTSFPCEEYSEWQPKRHDQSAKADAGKPNLTKVPRKIIRDIAKVRDYAWTKYGEGADRWDEVEIQRYREATYRHWLDYLDDPQGLDKESGLPHLSHLACNIAFLCEMEKGE